LSSARSVGGKTASAANREPQARKNGMSHFMPKRLPYDASVTGTADL
jgi:hypothetical protein